MKPVAPPAVGDALRAALDSMEATGMRRPLRELAWFLGLSLPFLVVLVASMGLRRDIGGLSTAWLAGTAFVWLVSFVSCAYLGFVPADKQVAPRSRQIFQALAASLLLLIGLGFFATEHVSGLSVSYAANPGSVFSHARTCSMIGLAAGVVPGVLALLCFRRFIPVGRISIGVGLGAAGGSLAGIFLLFHCPISERFHMALAHTSGIATAALFVAIASYWLLRDH